MAIYINPFVLAFFLGITLLGLGIVFFVLLKSTKTYPGFKKWGLSALLLSFATLLMGAKGFLSPILTVNFANFLAIAGMLLVNRGIHEFFDQKCSLWFDLILTVVFMSLHAYLSSITDILHIRTGTISIFHALALFPSLRLILKAEATQQTGFLPILTLSLGFYLFLNLVRSMFNIYFLINPLPGSDKIVLGISFIITTPAVLLVYISMLACNFKRTEESLLLAKSKIKTLFGILPICSHCKRIRTAQNDWLAVEVYVQRNSEANFSHGICPECLKKNFPEYNLEN